MNKRDWLRSQGFNVGNRGRLTPAMISALKDYTGEKSVAVALEVEMVPEYVNYMEDLLPIREARTLYGRDKEGNLISFTSCSNCLKHMSFCSCQMGVFAPIMVVATKEKEVYVN